MENAELIAVSTQSALRNQLGVIANNVANVNTTGFRAQTLRFEEFMMPIAEGSLFQGSRDQSISYVHDAESVYDFTPGATVETGAPLDVAINGDGWFTVETPNGPRYTRDGNFSINTNGELVNQSGYRVLSNGAPIVLTPEDTDIQIANDGTISSSQGTRGRLTAVAFDDPSLLKADGLNTFNGPDAKPYPTAYFIQGALEKSNAESIREITNLVEVTRRYESVSRLLKDMEDLRKTAVSRLGRIEA